MKLHEERMKYEMGLREYGEDLKFRREETKPLFEFLRRKKEIKNADQRKTRAD